MIWVIFLSRFKNYSAIQLIFFSCFSQLLDSNHPEFSVVQLASEFSQTLYTLMLLAILEISARCLLSWTFAWADVVKVRPFPEFFSWMLVSVRFLYDLLPLRFFLVAPIFCNIRHCEVVDWGTHNWSLLVVWFFWASKAVLLLPCLKDALALLFSQVILLREFFAVEKVGLLIFCDSRNYQLMIW